MNFWHQVNEVALLDMRSILEVGKGGGVVSDHLKRMGFLVTTLDIDADTRPDVVGDIMSLPFDVQSYDVILSAEVLEHLPFKKLSDALRELYRVTRRFVVISLPYRGSLIRASFKVPFLKKRDWCFVVPYFWKKHVLTSSGHYWEVGKRGFSRAVIREKFTDAGFRVKKEKVFCDDSDHIFFVLEKV